MKELEIDLHNCIEFTEKENFIEVRGSCTLCGADIDCYYSYPKCNDNKLRRIYAKNKIYDKLLKIAYLLFNPNLYENEWQH